MKAFIFERVMRLEARVFSTEGAIGTFRAVACLPPDLPNLRIVTESRLSRQRDDVRFRILALVERYPEISRRDLARELGVSLGSVNYCIKALLDKGPIKLENFRTSKHKLGYVYCLTPEGIAQRRDLASSFVERKRADYEAIKAELEQLAANYPDCSEYAPL